MIRLRVGEVAKSKGINKSQLSLKAQVGLGVVRRYWDNETTSVDLGVLDKLCMALGGTPGDLLDHSFTATPPTPQ